MTDRKEQAERMRILWSAVAITSINDAIRQAAREPKKHKGNALKMFTMWTDTRDCWEVLIMAGIDPNKRVIDGMLAFVAEGVPVTQLRKKGTKL